MMKKNKIILAIFIIIAICAIAGCKKEISQDEAFAIAKSFVDTNIKPYSGNDTNDTKNVLEHANAELISSSETADTWQFIININARINDTVKQRNLLVEVDKKTGQVLPPKTLSS